MKVTPPETTLPLGDIREQNTDGSLTVYRGWSWAEGKNGGGSYFIAERRIYQKAKK